MTTALSFFFFFCCCCISSAVLFFTTFIHKFAFYRIKGRTDESMDVDACDEEETLKKIIERLTDQEDNSATMESAFSFRFAQEEAYQGINSGNRCTLAESSSSSLSSSHGLEDRDGATAKASASVEAALPSKGDFVEYSLSSHGVDHYSTNGYSVDSLVLDGDSHDGDGGGLDSTDGYSVNSLELDGDSDDGFLSEEGEENTENKITSVNDDQSHLLQRSEENHENNLLDSLGSVNHKEEEEDAADEEEEDDDDDEEERIFHEEAKQFNLVIEEAKLVISRLCSMELVEDHVYSENFTTKELENSLKVLEREVEAEVGEEKLEESFEELQSSESCIKSSIGKVDDDDKEEEDCSEVCGGKQRQGPEKGDYDELEALWEHQNLLEHLSKELMFVRSTGLETIMEEPQSPNLAVKLKNWKFDASFLHENSKDQLQTFYKIYRERMRKFDILKYQKMFAVDLLHLKDYSHKYMNCPRPTVASLLTQSFLPCRRKKFIGGTTKFVKELRRDLENVYVGQTCLSWEFLWWQYEMSQEQLISSVRYNYRQYNRVAGEFQHFQVLIQRFMENEPFEVAARVPNYVKFRQEFCDFLQVPLIKEDSNKDKIVGSKKRDEVIVFLEKLNCVMERSIKVFWKFIKTDKDETPTIVKGLIRPQVELQDPSDSQLLVNVQTQLRKKEKKLNDLLRVGNCLVKKFMKPEEDRSSQDLFFSQVDLKLISRVLEMPRLTTDQLVWCHNKLSNINFFERKILREIVFLPFPCSV